MNDHCSTNSVAKESMIADNIDNEENFLSWFVAAVVDPAFDNNNDTVNIKHTDNQEDGRPVVDVAGVVELKMLDWTRHKDTHSLILDWFEIALAEEYIEPSQPQICKYLDWPTRAFPVNSLWIDFICWLGRNNLPNHDPSAKWLFESVCDQVFDRQTNNYTFPELELCRQRFQEVKKQ